MVSDPISDFLIRIKNGYLARQKRVVVSWSKINEKMAGILVKEGYLKNSKLNPESSSGQNSKLKTLELELKYESKQPVLTDVKRISKPGLRIYAKHGRIPKVRYGFGITLISTPKGLMIDKEARKNKLGGEVICQIW